MQDRAKDMIKFWKENIKAPLGFVDSAFMEPTSEDPIILGRQAQAALENQAIAYALNKIESGILHAWKTSKAPDGEPRERLYYRMEGLKWFKSTLQGMINNMVIEEEKKRQADKTAAQKEN